MSEIVEIGQQVEIAKLSYSPTEPNGTECVPIFLVTTEWETMNPEPQIWGMPIHFAQSK